MNTNQIFKKMSELPSRGVTSLLFWLCQVLFYYMNFYDMKGVLESAFLTSATDMITKKLECTLISKEFSSQVYHAEIYDLGFRQLSDIFPTVIFVASHF